MSLAALATGGICYDLLHSGLSNLLGVETLNHGTNGINYLGIRVFGGDPSQGGKSTGSTDNWCIDNPQNYFYLFKDSEFGNDNPVIASIIKRALPRVHCFLSGYNFNARLLPKSNSAFIRITKIFIGSIGGIFNACIVPTLHFHFSKIDSNRLMADPQYRGSAYRTTVKVEAWRLGILGTILTGVNLDWYSRAKANPTKIATGVVQLTCAVALTILMAKQFTEIMAFYAIAGAILA